MILSRPHRWFEFWLLLLLGQAIEPSSDMSVEGKDPLGLAHRRRIAFHSDERQPVLPKLVVHRESAEIRIANRCEARPTRTGRIWLTWVSSARDLNEARRFTARSRIDHPINTW